MARNKTIKSRKPKAPWMPDAYNRDPGTFDYKGFSTNYLLRDDESWKAYNKKHNTGRALPSYFKKDSEDMFLSMMQWGIDPTTAIGILANIATESGFVHDIISPSGAYKGLTQNSSDIWNFMGKHFGHDKKGQLDFIRAGLEGKLGQYGTQGKQLQNRFTKYTDYIATLAKDDPYRYMKAANAFDDFYEISDPWGKIWRLNYADSFGNSLSQSMPDYFAARGQSSPMMLPNTPLTENSPVYPEQMLAQQAPVQQMPILEQMNMEAPMPNYYLPQQSYTDVPFMMGYAPEESTQDALLMGMFDQERKNKSRKNPIIYLS